MFNSEELSQEKVLRYKGDIELVGVDNRINYKSQMMKNPIVIYDNLTPNTDIATAEKYVSATYNTMYDISDSEFNSFIDEFDLKNQNIVKSNVLDVYEYNFSIASRSMKIILMLSVFFIILEVLLIVLIIRMEYRINAVELALKKIYGYSTFERNGRLIKATIVSSLVSIIVGWIVLRYSSVTGSVYALLGAPLLLIIELIFIIYKSKSIEDQRLPLILKGERI